MVKPQKKQAKSAKKSAKAPGKMQSGSQSEIPGKPDAELKQGSTDADLSKTKVKQAILDGKAIIKEGKTKADAARAIFGLLKDEPKEVIVAAFVEGATLTEKGALTYWYNCRRKIEKSQNGLDM